MPATLDEVAHLAEALPDVTVSERHGHRTWLVGHKAFAWERPFSKADIKRFTAATFHYDLSRSVSCALDRQIARNLHNRLTVAAIWSLPDAKHLKVIDVFKLRSSELNGVVAVCQGLWPLSQLPIARSPLDV